LTAERVHCVGLMHSYHSDSLSACPVRAFNSRIEIVRKFEFELEPPETDFYGFEAGIMKMKKWGYNGKQMALGCLNLIQADWHTECKL